MRGASEPVSVRRKKRTCGTPYSSGLARLAEPHKKLLISRKESSKILTVNKGKEIPTARKVRMNRTDDGAASLLLLRDYGMGPNVGLSIGLSPQCSRKQDPG